MKLYEFGLEWAMDEGELWYMEMETEQYVIYLINNCNIHEL